VKQSAVPRTIFDAAIVRMALAAQFAPSSVHADGPGSGDSPAKKSLRPA
jgi:hypothetical protein